MADVKDWSRTASGNSGATPDFNPEGMSRKDVNDADREEKAGVRRWYEEPQWLNLLDEDDGFTVSRIDDTSFNVVFDGTPARDASSKFPVGARVRLSDAGGSPQLGFVESVSFVSPNTIVTVEIDGGDPLGNPTNRAETHATKGSVEDTAFTPLGTGTGQIPKADDLGSAAFKDEGQGSGLNADLLDGREGQVYLDGGEGEPYSLLINSDFGYFQRGKIIDNANPFFPNDNGKYGPDQWALLMGSGVTKPAAGLGVVNLEQTQAPGDVPPGRAAWGCKIVGNANVGSPTAEKFGLIQMLTRDRCQHLRGERVSVSFWAKQATGSAMGQLQVGILSWSGAEDSLSSIDPIVDWRAVGLSPALGANWSMDDSLADGGLPGLTDAWEKFTLENVLVPSNMNNLGILIWCDDQSWVSGDSLFMGAVNFVRSSAARSYNARPHVIESALCDRFFQSSFMENETPQQNVGSVNGAASGVAANNGRCILDYRFDVEMQSVPNVITYNPQAANALVRNVTDGSDTAISASYIGENQVVIETAGGGSDGNDYLAVHLTAEAVL